MDHLTLRTLDGETRRLERDEFRAFAEAFSGSLLFPGDPEYEEARQIWNGMVDRRPGLIARCANTADVVAAVNFAREQGLLVSVRSGGHNIAGMALSDGGLTIDLSQMKAVRVDPDAHRVWAEPGNTWGDLDRITQSYGLIIPGGIISTTGIAGFTLGGGFGWPTRKWGYTCDLLRAVEIVTADGQFRHVSADEHPDLFWALTGGGGNFGVVTSFEFEAMPLGPTVMAGLVFHPFDKAREVIRFFREVTSSAPEELTCLLVLRTAPPAPFLPEEVHGKPIVGIVASYHGPVEDAEPFMRPIKEFGSPLADTIGPKPFVEHQSFLDSGQPNGRGYYWKSDYFSDVSEGFGDALIDFSSKFSSPFSSLLMMHLGGAVRRVPADATAFAHRDAEYIAVIQAAWEPSAMSEEHIAWARAFFDAVHPYSRGETYLNFLNADDGDARTRQAYGSETYARLAQVKARYDPANLFRLNKNIQPAARDRAQEMQISD